MFRTILVCVFLALAMQVNGKPACGCQTRAPPPPPPPPTTSNPCVAKQEVTTTTTSKPCVPTTPAPKVPEPCVPTTPAPKVPEPCVPSTPAPKVPEPCREEATTTTTQAPAVSTTTTTVAPSTSTAAPRNDCTNGDIYPISVGGCNQFLMCQNRVYILMVCPQGLGFNFQTKACERSSNVPACRA